MKETLYKDAILSSFHFAWKQKALWVFGLLAAILGQMGVVDFVTKVLKIGITDSTTKVLLFPAFIRSGDWSLLFGNAKMTVSFILLVILLLCIFGLLVYASVSAQGAIIHNVSKAIKGKDHVDLGKSWQVGVKHSGRLFFLNAIKKIILFVSSIIIGIFIFALSLDYTNYTFAVYLLLFIILALVSLITTVLTIYSAGYVVVEEYHLFSAIKAAWKLFWSHWLVSIEVGFIILLSEIFVLVMAVWGVSILFLPTMMIWFLSLVSLNSALWTAGTTIAMILSTAYVMFLGAFFTVFATSVWTYLFMKMHKEGIASRLLHIFRK
ncbi:MAG: hypothetical protein V1848_00560 [Candidatus Magasanikbacteria bacterium]